MLPAGMYSLYDDWSGRGPTSRFRRLTTRGWADNPSLQLGFQYSLVEPNVRLEDLHCNVAALVEVGAEKRLTKGPWVFNRDRSGSDRRLPSGYEAAAMVAGCQITVRRGVYAVVVLAS